MGKIYKAATKVANEQGKVPLNGGTANHATPLLIETTEDFDFLGYSLKPTANGALEARQTESLELKARQVELNFTRLDPHLVMLNESDRAAAQQYHRLAAALVTAAREQPLKRLLVISALHGEGRTCVTLNLASALAQAGRRVVVIDADVARPSVLRLLGLESESVAGKTSKESSSEALLEIHPCGFKVFADPLQTGKNAALLSQTGFEQMLDRLDQQNDFILLDSAPLLADCDSHLLLYYVDKALLVTAPGKCSASEAARAIAPFPPEDIFGVVLNRATQ